MNNPEKEDKNNSEDLKNSEGEYQEIFNNLDVGYYKAKLDGTIIEHNRAVNIIGGYEPSEDFVGVKTRNFWDYAEEKEKYMELLMKNGFVKNYIVHVTTPQGKNLALLINSHIVRDQFDNPLYIEGTFVKVTEEYNFEQKLKTSQERLKFLVSSSPAIIYTSKTSGDYGATYISENVKELTGYDPEDFTRDSNFWVDHIHRDDKERVQSGLSSLYEKGHHQHEYRFQFKDGTYHWMLDDLNLIRDKKGNPVETIGYWIDITKRKEIEDKLRDSEKDLKKLMKELEQRIEERTRKLKESEEKYRKAYNQANFYKDLFAHDMYNILQNILSSSELCKLYLEYDKSQDRVDEVLGIIRDQVKKGSNLIFKVQKLSEIEEAQMPIESKNVCKFLKDSIDFVKESYQKKHINIQIDSINKNIFVQANDLLFDVFENILINGIRHNINSKIDLFIKISEERRKGVNYIKFEFKDNGIGIQNDHKEIIFQRDAKRDKGVRGMGLGLSLVKKIIDSYSGKIWVEDRIKGDYAKGSNFILLIPRAA